MQDILKEWKKFDNKEITCGDNEVKNFDELINLLSDNNFYVGNSGSGNRYSDSWSNHVYYAGICLFRLEILMGKIMISRSRNCEMGTYKIQDFTDLEKSKELTHYLGNHAMNSEKYYGFLEYIIMLKNEILNYLTQKVFLKEITLMNFRMFQNLSIELDPNFNAFVGINASGKSTILDSISIIIASFLSYFDSFPKSQSKSIKSEDIRLAWHEYANEYRAEQIFPASVKGCLNLNDNSYKVGTVWNKKDFNRMKISSFTTRHIVLALEEEVRKGNKDVILPVFAYYDVGRFLKTENSSEADIFDDENEKISRMDAYKGCLKARSNYSEFSRWFKLMKFKEFKIKKEIPGLKAVCKAIVDCINYPGAKLKVKDIDYDGNSIVLIDVKEKKYPLSILSDGYKSIIGMVADIAHRMLILNPHLEENVLCQTSGIVLIDELELHLHPKWQRHICKVLKKVFPMLQIIITTHSPNILVELKKNELFILKDSDIIGSNYVYGRDINSILLDIMGVEERPEEIKDKFSQVYKYIDEGELQLAKEIISSLEADMGENDVEILKARIAIEFEEFDIK